MKKDNFIKLFLLCTLLFSFSYAEALKIGSFNIQVLGKSKISKPVTSDILSSIISDYDIIFVQELRDKSGLAIKKLLNKVNKNSPDEYKIIISDRLGSSNTKEQYVFFYNSSKVKYISVFQYRGIINDFERDPFSVKFSYKGNEFILTGIHIDPDKAIRELNFLDDALGIISRKLSSKNIILLGDLNADCKYVPKYKLKKLHLKRDKRFTWHISDDEDTTVSKTNCAYDRIISLKTITPYVKNARVYRFEKDYELDNKQAKKVSDHYPVEFELDFKKKWIIHFFLLL